MLGLLLELNDPFILIGHHDTEAMCFLHRNGHDRDRRGSAFLFMEVKHHFIIHLVDMVA